MASDSNSTKPSSTMTGSRPFGIDGEKLRRARAGIADLDRQVLVVEPELLRHPERAEGAGAGDAVDFQAGHGCFRLRDFAASILDNRRAEPIGFRRRTERWRHPSRVVLLTGAAGGIGRVMTQALLADGHKVAAVDRDAAGAGARSRRSAAATRAFTRSSPSSSGEAGCRQAVEATRSASARSKR